MTYILLIPFFVVLIYLGLPVVLRLLGLHPYRKPLLVKLEGKKALIITTSQATLAPKNKKTGVYASEMTVPYYAFKANGMDVDIASIKGGEVPIEPQSLWWPIATREDKRFKRDQEFRAKTNSSMSIENITLEDYDLIYMAGGWGAAYDLGTSEELGALLTKAHQQGLPLGSVCHGSLGFLKAKNSEGGSLIKGKRISGVTNKQLSELMVKGTPMHPETELKNAGCDYRSRSGMLDLFQSHVEVDGKIVTGQNQNDGMEVASKLMELL